MVLNQSNRVNKKIRVKPLSNYDILKLTAKLEIPYFEGVFMRDELLGKKKSRSKKECWILNHGTSHTDGTHWTALAKIDNNAFYFDSFGKLPPPYELIKYLNKNISLYYNAKKYQNYGTVICGHLCLKFLFDFWRKFEKKDKKSRHYVN